MFRPDKPLKLQACYMILAGFLILCTGMAYGQSAPLYNYQQLSHVYYKKQKDSISKNWICPSLYKGKETQKKFKSIWEERTELITGSMERRCFLYDQDMIAYVDGIITDLAKHNQNLLKKKPLILIDRSSSVNAYTVGGNIIAVNLGLFNFVNSREELAFVLAHELSHNVLNHSDNFLKDKAEWLTSDEYKDAMKAVLESKYNRYSRLMKVYENYAFDRRRHSRYHESEADSLAIVMLKASHIPFNPEFYLRLDSADIQYKKPLKQPVREYFAAYSLPFEDWWIQKKTKGLSTRNNGFRDTTGIDDSLKTHPDCKARYSATLHLADANSQNTAIPIALKQKATKMLIWNLYDDNMLMTCLYRVLMEKDAGNNDPWYDFMMHNILGGLVYASNKLARFNAIGVLQKEYISKEYYELQNMLEQIPKDKLEAYYKASQNMPFWSQMSADAIALKQLIAKVSTETDERERTKAAKLYAETHAQSMYCEYTDHF